MVEPQCKHIEKQVWNLRVDGYPSYRLLSKLKIVRDSLKKWNNKECFGNLQVRKQILLEKLAIAQSNIQDLKSLDQERTIWADMAKHSFWLQKSRMNWIITGERNTMYLHLNANK